MFDHNEQPIGPHYDEMPFIRSIFDAEEDSYEEDDIELPLSDEEEEFELELDEDPSDPINAPEPPVLLAKVAEVKEALATVLSSAKVKQMPPTHPFETPEPAGLQALGLAMAAASVPKKGKKEEESETVSDDLEERFFQEGDKMDSGATLPPPVIELPQKKTWWSRLTDKIDSAVEKFGNFLDYAVPTVSTLTLVATLGGLASHISDFSKTASASTSVPVQTMAVMKATQLTPPVLATTFKSTEASNTLWTKDSTPASNNKFLVEKKAEIVQKAGGETAVYLHDSASYAHFTKELKKISGFGDVLKNPEVQKAKNIAEMINIIDRVFGEKVADLVEANAAAMHLSSASIQSLR